MSRVNNTTKPKQNQYHHLTEADRNKIQALVNQKAKNGKRLFNNTYIANYLGVHRSTISRELKNRKTYRFKRRLSKGEYKLRKYPKMAKFIEDKIKIDKWAPDVIVGYMKKHNYFLKDGFCDISVPSIYNAIRYGIINVKLEDTRRMKYKQEYTY